MTDIEVKESIAAVRSGPNVRANLDILSRHFGPLVGSVCRKISHPQDRQDVYDSSPFFIWRAAMAYDGNSMFSGWVFNEARREATNLRRRRVIRKVENGRETQTPIAFVSVENFPQPQPTFEKAFPWQSMDRAILTLQPRDQCIIRELLKGFDQREVARKIGVSKQCISDRYNRIILPRLNAAIREDPDAAEWLESA